MSDRAKLHEELVAHFGDRFELDVGAGGMVLLTLIHESFANQSRPTRMARVGELLARTGLRAGIIELYTPGEAEERNIVIPAMSPPLTPTSWESAISLLEAGRTLPDATPRKPRRVVFYSYKGGVGRTTAMVHTAFHLARANQRVVLVDMDVEAPGLAAVLPRPDGTPVTAGLVDYLWERQTKPFDSATGAGLDTCLVDGAPVGRTAISYAVEDSVSRSQIQVVPAGAVGSDYVRRLAALSSAQVLSAPDSAWPLFEKEVSEQLAPDILLIDARTGLGDWGGLTLLRLADEAFLVLFPSEQNLEGLHFVRDTLRKLGAVKTHLVLSPVPDGAIGRELVAKFKPRLNLGEDEELVEVFYNPSVAAAFSYPVETAMAGYARLSNIILETSTEDTLEVALQQVPDRRKLIESLKFPERDARAIAAGDFNLFFQKTSDFDKLLDDARWVIRGRKGTGKSTLFHLFTEHRDNAAKRARGKLEDIDILPGHGPVTAAALRPTSDSFETIHRELERTGHDWLSLWQAYAIIRMATSTSTSEVLEAELRKKEMAPLRGHLHSMFQITSDSPWRSTHTKGLLALVEAPFNELCRDLIGDMNRNLASNGRKLWLLYDDLDQDIKEGSAWQGEALGGLLRLAYDSNNRDLHNIRFKVFLREDIWGQLVFTNKSHFGEPRTLLLQWKIEDFLRLALRLATGGSPAFKSHAERVFPLTEAELDSASEEELRKALAPLWGLTQEKSKNAFSARWVYNRMTDASSNTYPRSLTVLLNAAREEELRANNEKLVPKDRLLSPRAMQAGLKVASIERTDALKNEYPDLRQFLEDVQKKPELRSQFMTEELERVWRRTSGETFKNFKEFVSKLVAVGLLRRGEKYDYGFAQLYIDGLGVVRVQGEKK